MRPRFRTSSMRGYGYTLLEPLEPLASCAGTAHVAAGSATGVVCLFMCATLVSDEKRERRVAEAQGRCHRERSRNCADLLRRSDARGSNRFEARTEFWCRDHGTAIVRIRSHSHVRTSRVRIGYSLPPRTRHAHSRIRKARGSPAESQAVSHVAKRSHIAVPPSISRSG